MANAYCECLRSHRRCGIAARTYRFYLGQVFWSAQILALDHVKLVEYGHTLCHASSPTCTRRRRLLYRVDRDQDKYDQPASG